MERFRADVTAHVGQIEAGLVLGAAPAVTVAPYVQSAVYASLLPRLDMLKSLGFVWIPGVMAGMLVSGASPVYAGIFQFVIVAMILAASGIAGLVATLLMRTRAFLESRTVDAPSWGRNLTTGRSIHGCINPEDNIMARAAALSNITSQSGLARYFEQIRRFPLLEPQVEFMLARRWRERGDRDAEHRLDLRLVAKIAAGYRGYGLPASEIIAEGNLGLMQAVRRFDPEKGFRLTTYAIWWIRASIQDYVLRSWSLVKIGTTANQRKLFFNLRRQRARFPFSRKGICAPNRSR
jgi:hypothetical protein